jgi:excinuclease ABC subunit A
MWSLMKDVCREMGVRTDVPFRELTPEERDIVYHGPAEKKHLLYHNEKTGIAGEMDFTYYNAIYTVENALSKVKDEKGLKRVARFLTEGPCPECGGTRLSEKVRSTMLCGMYLAEATAMTLDELVSWIPTVAPSLPGEMRPMAHTILSGMAEPASRLQQLGLGYLALDRASSTLSTGERQRVQLTRAVRNRTNGVLYVLDEPSIGLHPSNVDGLLGVVDDLLADGNSVVVVDHDVRVLRRCSHIVEIGPGSGAAGGKVIAQGSVDDIEACEQSTLAFERAAHCFDAHGALAVAEEFCRAANKRWGDESKAAKGDDAAYEHALANAFAALRTTTLLMHAAVPMGCELIAEHLGFEKDVFFSWDHAFETPRQLAEALGETAEGHAIVELPPRFDFFRAHESQGRRG